MDESRRVEERNVSGFAIVAIVQIVGCSLLLLILEERTFDSCIVLRG